jgi:hypothetical protein
MKSSFFEINFLPFLLTELLMSYFKILTVRCDDDGTTVCTLRYFALSHCGRNLRAYRSSS